MGGHREEGGGWAGRGVERHGGEQAGVQHQGLETQGQTSSDPGPASQSGS